jgi:DNA repair exonuclease SbcCD ATPase subunit
MNLSEHIEKTVDKLRTVETQLTDEARMNVFAARRYLQAGLFEYEKQGERITVRKEFVLCCPVCNAEMGGEEALYLHLRKIHKVSETEAAEHANAPRTAYDNDILELRRLLAEYTDSDLEDEFTRGFNLEATNTSSNELSGDS